MASSSATCLEILEGPTTNMNQALPLICFIPFLLFPFVYIFLKEILNYQKPSKFHMSSAMSLLIQF